MTAPPFKPLLLISLVLAGTAAGETITGTVDRVGDGDDVFVIADGERHEVRLVAIDAPELDQPFGDIAKETLTKWIDGKTVRVEWTKRDRYKRKLGMVYLAETNINEKLVAEGLAWHYKRYSNDATLAKRERTARDRKRGLSTVAS